MNIGGRVVQPNGRGVPGAIWTLEDLSTGEVFSTRTNRFGYYTFYDVEAGGFYTLSIANQRHRFVNSSMQFFADTDMFNMKFVSSH